MPINQTQCPQCHKPVVVQIEQIFDLNVSPAAKQLLFSGIANTINCPKCGFNSLIPQPIIYHDPDKELLLTYIPTELGLPRDEQEKLIGKLMNNVIEQLSPEKRKAYLLNPQSFISKLSFFEKINDTDGITNEMFQDYKHKKIIVHKLLTAKTGEDIDKIINEEKDNIDKQVILDINQLIEHYYQQNDEKTTQHLTLIENKLISDTESGRKFFAQIQESASIQKQIENAGEYLNREKVLEIAIASSDSEIKLFTLVSITRNLMDYQFFQILTDRLTKTKGEEQIKLMQLRGALLNHTEKIDKTLEKYLNQAKVDFDKIMRSSNIENAIIQNMLIVNEFFVKIVSQELEEARVKGDLERSEKISKMQAVIMELIQPDEVKIIEQLLVVKDDNAINEIISNNKEMINESFLSVLELYHQNFLKEGDQEHLELIQKIIKIVNNLVK